MGLRASVLARKANAQNVAEEAATRVIAEQRAKAASRAELQYLAHQEQVPKALGHLMFESTRKGHAGIHVVVIDPHERSAERLDKALLAVAQQALQTPRVMVEFLLPLSRSIVPVKSAAAGEDDTATTAMEDLTRLAWSGVQLSPALRDRIIIRTYDVREELIMNPVTALSMWSYFSRNFPHQRAYTKYVMSRYAEVLLRHGAEATLQARVAASGALQHVPVMSALCALGTGRAMLTIVVADVDVASGLMAFAGATPDLGRLVSQQQQTQMLKQHQEQVLRAAKTPAGAPEEDSLGIPAEGLDMRLGRPFQQLHGGTAAQGDPETQRYLEEQAEYHAHVEADLQQQLKALRRRMDSATRNYARSQSPADRRTVEETQKALRELQLEAALHSKLSSLHESFRSPAAPASEETKEDEHDDADGADVSHVQTATGLPRLDAAGRLRPNKALYDVVMHATPTDRLTPEATNVKLGPWAADVYTYALNRAMTSPVTDLLVYDPGVPVLFVAPASHLLQLNTVTAHDNAVLYSQEDLSQSHAMRVLQAMAGYTMTPLWLQPYLKRKDWAAPYWNELHALIQLYEGSRASEAKKAIVVLPQTAWPLQLQSSTVIDAGRSDDA
jgi:hypothetical protein